MRELVIIAHVPTAAVDQGFIPAAKALGLSITLLTDTVSAYREQFAKRPDLAQADQIIGCDVFNPLAIIDCLTRRSSSPAAIFSNSDHLQSATSLAAAYFGLPGKDWRTTYRAKNKAQMRAHLAQLGIDTLWHQVVSDAGELQQLLDQAEISLPLPCIVKPREGVASEMVSLAYSREQLQEQCLAIWQQHSDQALLLEQYMPGELYTLETLGDGRDVLALGGFHTRLSPPPHFVELDVVWGTGLGAAVEQQVLQMIRRFGVGFGACHTEFVMSEQGPRLIEINYRNIGDFCEFQLAKALNIPLFEIVLGLYLGQPLPRLQLASDCAWIRYFTAAHGGILQQAPQAFELQHGSAQLQYQPLRQQGESIALTHSNRDYLGVLRGAAPSREHLAQAMAHTSAQLHWEIAA